MAGTSLFLQAIPLDLIRQGKTDRILRLLGQIEHEKPPMNAEREPTQEAIFGSPEWAAFKDAIKQAVSEAVEEHLRAGNPAYFTDGGGNICELSPDTKTRKLTREEVDQLISEEASS
jgi:hypothetical protein